MKVITYYASTPMSGNDAIAAKLKSPISFVDALSSAMTSTQTAYKYVVLDEDAVPVVAGTTLKVVEIVEAQQTYGWSPEEYHLNHRYLKMGQIYSALAYYWDHKEALDKVLEERKQFTSQAVQTALPTRCRGEAMAAALEKLSRVNAFQGIDPVAWQRDIRQDKSLFGRE